EHGVAEEPDRQPPDAGEALARDVGGDLAPLDGLVQSRQRLRTEERRCEKLVRLGDLDFRACQVEGGAGVDDESGHRVPRVGCRSVTTLPLRPSAFRPVAPRADRMQDPTPYGRRQAPRLSCAHPRRSGRVAEGGALLRRYGGECLHRGFESLLLRFAHGEVSEWPKERDWKSRTC